MNKYERVAAVLKNELPDRIPAGFWYHYNGNDSPETMVGNHIRTFRETDVDVYKIMQDYIPEIDQDVSDVSDLRKIRFPGRSSETYKKLLSVLKGILDTTGHDAFTFQTMYGPLKTLAITYGDKLIMHFAETAPEELLKAEFIVAEGLKEWACGFIEAGADGIFYSGQFSEPGRFSHETFDMLVKQGDLEVLKATEEKGAKNILHICGEPDYDFHSTPEWYVDYPFAIVNWSVKDTGLSLQQGRELFDGRPILGGMNNKGNILKGPDSAIQNEAEKVIGTLDGVSGFMLGADCTIQGETIENPRIRVAVETAHSYPLGKEQK